MAETRGSTNEAQLKDAAMLLRLAVRKLKKGDGSAQCFADKITDWLKRNGLQGSILRTSLITLLLLLSGCAARPPHARIVQAPTTLCSQQKEKPSAEHPCLSEEFWQCDGGACYLTRSWEPSQMTVAGCALHYVVTFGKVPLECKRRPRAGD